jgi:hypothetical protein
MPSYILSEPYKQRVDNALATVEGMPSQQKTTLIPTRFETLQQPQKVFRICTFTGAWPINTSKTVTFRGVTNTPNTVSAVNLFYDLPNNGNSTCAIAKDGTAWYLVQDVHTTMTVITGASLTTAGLQFTRAVVTVVATATASVQTVGTTAC